MAVQVNHYLGTHCKCKSEDLRHSSPTNLKLKPCKCSQEKACDVCGLASWRGVLKVAHGATPSDVTARGPLSPPQMALWQSRSYTYLDEDAVHRLYTSLACPLLEYGKVMQSPLCKKDARRMLS